MFNQGALRRGRDAAAKVAAAEGDQAQIARLLGGLQAGASPFLGSIVPSERAADKIKVSALHALLPGGVATVDDVAACLLSEVT